VRVDYLGRPSTPSSLISFLTNLSRPPPECFRNTRVPPWSILRFISRVRVPPPSPISLARRSISANVGDTCPLKPGSKETTVASWYDFEAFGCDEDGVTIVTVSPGVTAPPGGMNVCGSLRVSVWCLRLK
jgi:hypothetical protein